jgi:hypothetical protein
MFECFTMIDRHSFIRIFKYEPKLRDIHQIEISGDHAFIAADLHNKDRIKEYSYIECFNMFKEEQIRYFHFSCKMYLIKIHILFTSKYLKKQNP